MAKPKKKGGRVTERPCTNRCNPDHPACRRTSRDRLTGRRICSWCGRGCPGRVRLEGSTA